MRESIPHPIHPLTWIVALVFMGLFPVLWSKASLEGLEHPQDLKDLGTCVLSQGLFDALVGEIQSEPISPPTKASHKEVAYCGFN